MIKVDFYSAEVKYTGSFDSYTHEDWKKMAIAKFDRGVDPYDETVEVETWEEARTLEEKNNFVAEDRFPCNKLAIVRWAYIREQNEEEE